MQLIRCMAFVFAVVTFAAPSFANPGTKPDPSDFRFDFVAGIVLHEAPTPENPSGIRFRGSAILIGPRKLITCCHVLEWGTATLGYQDVAGTVHPDPARFRIKFARNPHSTITDSESAFVEYTPVKIYSPRVASGTGAGDFAVIELSEADSVEHIVPARVAPPDTTVVPAQRYLAGWGAGHSLAPGGPELPMGVLRVLSGWELGNYAVSSSGFSSVWAASGSDNFGYFAPFVPGEVTPAGAGDSGGAYAFSFDPIVPPATVPRARIHQMTDFGPSLWQLDGVVRQELGVTQPMYSDIPAEGAARMIQVGANARTTEAVDLTYLTSRVPELKWTDSYSTTNLDDGVLSTSFFRGSDTFFTRTSSAAGYSLHSDPRFCGSLAYAVSNVQGSWELEPTTKSGLTVRASLSGSAQVAGEQYSGAPGDFLYLTARAEDVLGGTAADGYSRYIIPFRVATSAYELAYLAVSMGSSTSANCRASVRWTIVNSRDAIPLSGVYPDPNCGCFVPQGGTTAVMAQGSATWDVGVDATPANQLVRLPSGDNFWFVVDIKLIQTTAVQSYKCKGSVGLEATPNSVVSVKLGGR
jgi:hypothetical protein